MKTVTAIASVILIFAVGTGMVSCSRNENLAPDPGERIRVVATIFPLSDIIRQIGGDRVEVVTLLGPGSSPHTYEPTVEQAIQVAGADMVIHIGGGLDDWAVRLAVAESTTIVTIMDYLGHHTLASPVCHHDGETTDHEECDDNPDHDHDHDHGPHDPHVWLDPVLVGEIMVPVITRELLAADPQGESEYEANREHFQSRLQDLDQEIRSRVASFSRTGFISYHSAFGYFAHRYGLQEVATVEEFAGKEPSARWLAQLVDLAQEHRVDIIFAEPQLSQRAADIIAAEIGGRVLVLDPLGGGDLQGRSSYIELMLFNLGALEEALR